MGITLSDEQLSEAVKVRAESRTLEEAAAKLGLARSSFSNRLLRAAQRGLDGNVPKPLPLGQVLRGVSTLYKTTTDADGNKNVDTVLEWVKTRDEKSLEDITAALREAFEQYKGYAKPIAAPKRVDADLLSVYPIGDAHVGLMAWNKDASEDYDLKIGATRLRECAGRLISQSPPSKTAIILNLGDWQHTDDAKNMTPRSGNLLDVDGRYFKVLTTGIQLMMDIIELALQKHEKVIVRNLPGNHDPHSSVALTVALGAFYAKNKRVTIEQDPSDFFFYRFGSTLIGANHGHKMRADRMAMSMAVRRREDWGQTKFHYFYFGHIHHETAKEVGDVRCESFQTLAAKDAHAHSSGYNSGQSITSITIDKKAGEIGRHRVNVSPDLLMEAA